MKNVNAIVNIEALDESNNIITYDEESGAKTIPIIDGKARLVISFYYSIINGQDDFFAKHQALQFQIRILDKGKNNIGTLKDCFVDLNKFNNKSYYNAGFVDFISDKSEEVVSLDLNNIEPNSTYILCVLVRDKKAVDEGEAWIIQSVSQLNFKK